MNDETIKLKSGANVSKENYITLKTSGLVEAGHVVTRDDVAGELCKVLSGGSLSVIGHFIMSDLAENQNERT